jgi:hypothetical protein
MGGIHDEFSDEAIALLYRILNGVLERGRAHRAGRTGFARWDEPIEISKEEAAAVESLWGLPTGTHPHGRVYYDNGWQRFEVRATPRDKMQKEPPPSEEDGSEMVQRVESITCFQASN